MADKKSSADDLKERWSKLEPKTQTTIKKYGVVAVVIVFLTVYYFGSGRDENRNVVVERELAPILSEELLEDDVRQSVKDDLSVAENKIEITNQQLEQQQQQIEDLKQLLTSLGNAPVRTPLQQPSNDAVDPLADIPAANGDTPYGGSVSYPESRPIQYFEYPENQQSLPEAEPQLVGGIGYSAGMTQDPMEADNQEKKRLIRLPPSFMKASLLVGIDAMTSALGEANPEPIILRVQAPAVLPNRVKQNLEGCFIVADAYGNLAKERVQVRLVSLHCNSLDGKAVIDQKIEGFVADTDGKRDLAGIVISKAGANMARAAAASMIGGFGEALGTLGTSVTTTSVSTTTQVDTDKLALGAAANGIGAGAGELAQIYTDLVKQATPTIEVGAAKELTVIIQKTVELEIKEYE